MLEINLTHSQSCHEWPLRDTHVLSVEAAADSEDTQIPLPTSWTAHGPDLPPPTPQPWNSLSSEQQLWLCGVVRARSTMTGGNLSEMLSSSVTFKPLTQQRAPPHVELEVQGDEVATRELNPWNQTATVFKDSFQEITKANLARPWSQNNKNTTLPFMLMSIRDVGLHPATGLKPHPCFLGLCFTFLSGELN